MASFATDRPWTYAVLCTVLWIALWVGIDVVRSGGDVVGAAITGAFGGLVFAAATIALRRIGGTE